jgi:hypothetical protein
MRVSLLFLVFLISFHTEISAQNYTVILGRPTDQSVTANILFDQSVILKVEFGTVTGVYTSVTAEFTANQNEPKVVPLSGLNPNTRYYYRLRYRLSSESLFRTGNECTFQTQRSRGSTFSFTIEADPHPYDKKCYAPLWNIALQNQLNDKADFMLDLGDTFGDDHEPFTITNSEIRQLHLDNRAFFGKVCHSLPLFFCLGNHEGESGYYLLQTPPNNLATSATIWRKYYYPNPVPDGFYSGNSTVEGNGIGLPENYYAWEWGDALFVVVDAYRYYTVSAKPTKWDWTIGKTQYDWLKQTLEKSTAKFKFVFAHHVLGEARGAVLAKLYEWGGTDGKSITSDFAANRPGWEMPLHQLMVKNKVNIFFQGHDHLYAKEELDGLVYQTVPMPSDSSYTLGMIANADAFGGTKLSGSGHLRVTVNSDKVQVDFVNAVLPSDETASLKNGSVAFSYAINSSGVSTSAAILPEIKPEPPVRIYPNPFQDFANIYFTLKQKGKVEIFISDISGKLVSRFDFGIMESGLNTFRWDATNVDGKSVLPGIYLCQIKTQDGLEVSKMIHLK